MPTCLIRVLFFLALSPGHYPFMSHFHYNPHATKESLSWIMKRIILLTALVLLLGLAACGGDPGGSTPTDRPARAIEEYLSAKIGGDDAAIRALLCSEMEPDLERELHTFDTVSNASIENMSCASDDPSAVAETSVRCTGRIVALYGTEETEFPLAAYRAVSEDGEWKWCGEAE